VRGLDLGVSCTASLQAREPDAAIQLGRQDNGMSRAATVGKNVALVQTFSKRT
jgi:hypothetical protein